MTNTRHRPSTRPGRAAAALAALAAGIGLLVLLLAPPLLLTHFVGNPAAGFSHFSFTKPLSDTQVEGLLAAVIWVAWAQLAVCVLAETRAQLRARRVPGAVAPARRVPLTFGFQQRLARRLVIACLAFVSMTPAVAGTAIPAWAGTPSAPVATAAYTAAGDKPAGTSPTPGTAAPGTTVLVRPGQDLSELAQHYLGSAQRWPAVWDANRGRVEPGGEHFTDPNLIKPGWTLNLPTEQPDPATASTSGDHIDVTVARGDTLWSLAETHLGSGEQWPRIWALTEGTRQPDGRIATDPSRVRVGWTVRIPAPARPAAGTTPPSAPNVHLPETPQPAAAPQVAPISPPPTEPSPATRDATTPAAAAPSTASGQPDPSHAASVTAAAAEQAPNDAGPSALARTGLGLTVIAAAAVVGAVGRRRITQQRARRIGRRIAMPADDVRAAERELRVTEDAEIVRLLDLAARTLMLVCQTTGQTFPPVAVVRLFHRGVELLLTEAAPAIEPFIAAGQSMWRFDAATAGHLLTDEAQLRDADIAFPWPLLVTIGVDDRGPVMVNLEAAGALTVVGEPAHTMPVLTAAAVELATSSLSAMATVHLVGLGADIASAAETGRATAHDDLQPALAEAARFHRDTAATLRADGYATMHAARTAGQADLTFPSHALVCCWPLAPADRKAIAEGGVATPGFGTGLITTANQVDEALPGWVLRLSAALQLHLEPFGLTVRPQQLHPGDLARVGDLLRISGDLDDIAPADPAWAAAANINYTAVIHRPLASTSIDPGDRPGALPDSPLTNLANVDEPPAVDAEAAPMIRVLGPVTLTGARGEDPGSRKGKALEVAAFLALHPGAGRDVLTENVWPTKRVSAGHRQNQMWLLRTWLGNAPGGQPYVGSQAGAGAYTLHPAMRCDWTEFATLAKRGFAGGIDGLPDLEAALRLVRGRPFSGVRSGTYAWAETITQADIIPAIRDVADAIAQIRLTSGDPAGARAATALGLLADPASEQLLRTALRAAHLRGDHDDLADLVARLDRINDEIGDNDPETVELLALVLADHHASQPTSASLRRPTGIRAATAP